jgi:hypothetical protein
VNETKSHLSIGKKELIGGDGKGLAGAHGHGRRDTTMANARAITAMSAPARREPFIAGLPGVGREVIQLLYTEKPLEVRRRRPEAA